MVITSPSLRAVNKSSILAGSKDGPRGWVGVDENGDINDEVEVQVTTTEPLRASRQIFMSDGENRRMGVFQGKL